MVYASWISDLASLTWLVLGVLGFFLALIYRGEIKAILGRITNFEAKRKDTVVRAVLDGEKSSRDNQEEAQPDMEESEETTVDEISEEVDSPTDSEEPEDVDPDALRQAMFRSFADGEDDEGERQFEQLVALTSDPAEGKRDQVRRYAGRFLGGVDQSALEQLRQLASDPEIAGFAFQMIGICLEKAQVWGDAAEAYASAVQQAAEPADRAMAAVGRARALSGLGDFDTPIRELRDLLRHETDPGARATLWEGFAAVQKKAGDPQQNAIALHQVAELAVNDSRKWFSAGYAYADVSTSASFALMAIYCYRNALKFDDNFAAAQNNLAARLSTLDLRLAGMQYYREAAALGNTLAMANIGQAYLNAGFGDEAKKILEEASSRPQPHPNVAAHLARLAGEQAKQGDKVSEFEAEGARVGDMMTAFASATLQDPLEGIDGPWMIGNTTQVHVEISDKTVTLKWSPSDFTARPRRFVGRIDGSGAFGRFEKKVSLVVTDERWEADGTGFMVVEKSQGNMRLTRLSGTVAEHFRLRRSA